MSAPVVVRPPLIIGQDAISDDASARAVATLDDAGGRTIVVHSGKPRVAVLVLYPGGLVRPQAYEWLGRRLAADGIETWIPEMPFDLAALGPGRFEAIREKVGHDVPLVLAGHSLGGVIACDDAFNSPTEVDGLILLGAYPSGDKRQRTNWKPLLIAAERDGLSTPAKMDVGLAQLPPGTSTIVIPGAVHSFFGRYGPQAGDDVPTTSRADAEAAIAASVRGYVLGAGRS